MCMITALAITGGILGVVMADQQAQTEAEMAGYQADLAEQNRAMYERQAADIHEQGLLEKRNLALQQAAQLGKMRAGAGASGTALGTGSSLLMEEDAAQTAGLDMQQLDYDIRSREWESKIGAWNAGNQASAFRAQSSNINSQRGMTMTGGLIQTAGDGLSSIAKDYGLTEKMGWNGSLLKPKSDGHGDFGQAFGIGGGTYAGFDFGFGKG